MYFFPTAFKLVKCGLRKIFVRVSRSRNSVIRDGFPMEFLQERRKMAPVTTTYGEFCEYYLFGVVHIASNSEFHPSFSIYLIKTTN